VDGEKAPLGPKSDINGEKNEPVALAIAELCWSEGIRQSVS